jgi:hypothetical protein
VKAREVVRQSGVAVPAMHGVGRRRGRSGRGSGEAEEEAEGGLE